MGLSLRDQLLQAGLISEKQAKQAKRQQHDHKTQQAPGKSAEPSPQQLAAQKAAEEKRLRDQELNRQREAKAEQKARRAQVKQLVDQHRVPKVESEQLYNFIDGKRIRRLPVSPEQRALLIAGTLAIVRCDGRYEFVPAEIAERIRERDPHAVVSTGPQASDATPAEDDPYKDFVVPDDLMW